MTTVSEGSQRPSVSCGGRQSPPPRQPELSGGFDILPLWHAPASIWERRSGKRRKLELPPLAAELLDLDRLRLVLLESADQVGNVGELLLEVTLVLLEAFENALWLVPASADPAAAETSVSVMHVHPLLCS
jgi:hypothetical protein